MENHVSPIRYNSFHAIFLMSEFCCASSRTQTYQPYLHTKLMSSFKQRGKGNVAFAQFSDVKKAKGNMAYPCACNPDEKRGHKTRLLVSKLLMP